MFRYGNAVRKGTVAWSTASWMLADMAPSGTLDALHMELTPATPGMVLRPSALLSPLGVYQVEYGTEVDRKTPTVKGNDCSVFLKGNWNVMSSTASPLLSMWISYKALGSIEK